MVVASARRAPGSTVRVEVLRLPPLTLFALEDNQSSASARTHRIFFVTQTQLPRACACLLLKAAFPSPLRPTRSVHVRFETVAQ